jgi:hypothetical protein
MKKKINWQEERGLEAAQNQSTHIMKERSLI